MASVEELLSTIIKLLKDFKSLKPKEVICGLKDHIGTDAVKLVEKPTPIGKSVTVKLRTLDGAATYVAIGNNEHLEYQFTVVGDSHDVDWIDDLSKVFIEADAGTDSVVEFIGG